MPQSLQDTVLNKPQEEDGNAAEEEGGEKLVKRIKLGLTRVVV